MFSPDAFVEGGLYVTTAECPYGILKILKMEEGIAHVKLYKNKYEQIPARVDPESLSVGTIHDEDGFGVGDLPNNESTLASWRPQLLQITLVESEELEGYEIWRESKGSVWE